MPACKYWGREGHTSVLEVLCRSFATGRSLGLLDSIRRSWTLAGSSSGQGEIIHKKVELGWLVK